MADFNDTTGWLEELDEYLSSEAHKQKIEEERRARTTVGIPSQPSLNAEEIVPIVALMLRDSACLEAAKKMQDWYDSNLDVEEPHIDDEDDKGYPFLARHLTESFPSWYHFKANLNRHWRHDGYAVSCFWKAARERVSSEDTENIKRIVNDWFRRVQGSARMSTQALKSQQKSKNPEQGE